ncbi:MAG: lysophospholipid acyltransferase family protein [Limisphaerales bacterium]
MPGNPAAPWTAPDREALRAPADELRRRPLPALAREPLTRLIIRGGLLAGRGLIHEVHGAEHVTAPAGAFVLTPSHGTRHEALLFPILVAALRGGRIVPFLADWNFAMIPVVGLVMRRGRCIFLTRKPAKPAFLNVFRPLFAGKVPAFERARRLLAAGSPVGVFPEGTVNADSRRLLRGHSGAAQLSLQTGAPVVPAGLRYHRHALDGRIHPRAPFTVVFGPPMVPPATAGEPELGLVRDWHQAVMQEIARLAGRGWAPDHHRKKS